MPLGTIITATIIFIFWVVASSIAPARIPPRWVWSAQLAKVGIVCLLFGVFGLILGSSLVPAYGSALNYVVLYTTLYFVSLGASHWVKVKRHEAWVSAQIDLSIAAALRAQSQPPLKPEEEWPQWPPRHNQLGDPNTEGDLR